MQDQSDKQGQEGPSRGREIEDFTARLTDEDRMLVILQGQLYEGSWEVMQADLSNRLEGKPYIFKLANRIRDDIARIDKLQEFEKKHNVRLSDYVKPPESPENGH